MVRLALLLCLLLPVTAHAARLDVGGWDTCDEQETTEGGTAGLTTISTTARTGRCALRVAPTAASSGYHETAFTSASEAYVRVARRTLTSATAGDVELGFWGDSHYGCRVDLEPDDSLTVRFKDRTTYLPLGQTGTSSVAAGSYHTAELHQLNGSGGSCASNCVVTCELWLDGARVVSVTADSIAGADYDAMTSVRYGAGATTTGAYDVLFDDRALDSTTHLGVGRAFPLTPDGDGTPNQWNNSCGGTRAGCLDDYASAAPATDDGTTTDVRETASGNKTTLTMTTTTLASGETLQSVAAFGIAKEVADDARDWRLNITDGDGGSDGSPSVTGTTSSPGTTYILTSRVLSATMPGGGAWTQSALNSLTLQLEHRTNTGNIDVTAVLAYADIQEPDPAIAQNLQDWDGDGRLTLCPFGDSITRGTGLGACAGDASVQCSTNDDCGGNAPCQNTGKYPTIFGALVTQKTGSRSTTVLNAGIDGNTTEDLKSRLPTLLTGVGIVNRRYCILDMPTTCTPTDITCTGTDCASTDCPSEPTGGRSCRKSAALVIGSKVCSGSHATDCTSDSDCSGVGTCSDYPGCDYVLELSGTNDLIQISEQSCTLNPTRVPPCPPLKTPSSLVTPALTPAPTATPGLYGCPRVACNATSECSGGSAGLCTGNVRLACDSNADCTGVGTCSTALRLPGNISECVATCTANTTRFCTSNGYCQAGDTCSASKACTCPCVRVPCTTAADCGPALQPAASSAANVRATTYGACTGGFCANCGPPGCPTDAKFTDFRETCDAAMVTEDLQSLATTTAASTRRLVFLTHSAVHQPCTYFGIGGIVNDVLMVRDWLLATMPNVVDLWFAMKHADQMATNSRCNNSPTRTCASNADCTGTGAQCVVYASTLRTQQTATAFDEVHPNSIGASVMAEAAYDYLQKLSPVCSGDTTTGCGRCSIATTTACTISSDCPGFSSSGEKCTKTDSVCSGAGKGLCTQERACYSASDCANHSLCTRDLSTKCLSDSDCTAITGSTCRPEGLLAPGAG